MFWPDTVSICSILTAVYYLYILPEDSNEKYCNILNINKIVMINKNIIYNEYQFDIYSLESINGKSNSSCCVVEIESHLNKVVGPYPVMLNKKYGSCHGHHS